MFKTLLMVAGAISYAAAASSPSESSNGLVEHRKYKNGFNGHHNAHLHGATARFCAYGNNANDYNSDICGPYNRALAKKRAHHHISKARALKMCKATRNRRQLKLDRVYNHKMAVMHKKWNKYVEVNYKKAAKRSTNAK